MIQGSKRCFEVFVLYDQWTRVEKVKAIWKSHLQCIVEKKPRWSQSFPPIKIIFINIKIFNDFFFWAYMCMFSFSKNKVLMYIYVYICIYMYIYVFVKDLFKDLTISPEQN